LFANLPMNGADVHRCATALPKCTQG
jgi:hypothetical protein